MTKRCDSGSLERRFFSDFLSSLTEYPSYEMSQLETYSAVYIAAHENPIVLQDNEFTENVGVLGGALTIDRPNFVYGDYGVSAHYDYIYKPFTVIKSNKFTYNQAYASGNAVYIRNNR